jgi:hypothetical protein
MKPGRELDILVAQHVMGWARLPSTQPEIEAAGGMWAAPRAPRMLLPFSTDINRAFVVVEEMRKRGYRFSLADQPGTNIKIVGFFNSEEYGASVGETTEAHAICSAALGALGFGPV